jgi:hypothetical protein
MVTDREMAIQLGRYIIRMQRRIKALEGAFTEYRLNSPYGPIEVPWIEKVEQIENEEYPRQVASAQLHSLLQTIDAETQDSLLIRVLHREFLEE